MFTCLSPCQLTSEVSYIALVTSLSLVSGVLQTLYFSTLHFLFSCPHSALSRICYNGPHINTFCLCNRQLKRAVSQLIPAIPSALFYFLFLKMTQTIHLVPEPKSWELFFIPILFFLLHTQLIMDYAEFTTNIISRIHFSLSPLVIFLGCQRHLSPAMKMSSLTLMMT